MELRLDRFAAEPRGWETARVFVFGSLAFFGLYASFAVVSGSGDATMLVFGVANAMAGVAELLPKRRQRWVNALRAGAVGVLLLVVAGALGRLLW
ncbi:hypothetical protein [Halogeometricum sp. CBA1124]|uniref:hypothetical protein n=1 Tax=Halogeometricum sp. CBA1124 TaxID=2668071 RepID=UPI00142AC04F|nr:hypothetical protein [Halogeometricum sp. CBA1124]MUV56443.1 hypothetical protein [Halogeometricum sp. CBA1124]